MRRLVAADLLPERAGQPVKAWVHISLADLLMLDGSSALLEDCVLLCWFHHHVVIHRWGWTLVLNPDGTTTAWNPDKTRVLRSHSPPAGAR
jgi:hypothetical protein